jgi:hypothetical protein
MTHDRVAKQNKTMCDIGASSGHLIMNWDPGGDVRSLPENDRDKANGGALFYDGVQGA